HNAPQGGLCDDSLPSRPARAALVQVAAPHQNGETARSSPVLYGGFGHLSPDAGGCTPHKYGREHRAASRAPGWLPGSAQLSAHRTWNADWYTPPARARPAGHLPQTGFCHRYGQFRGHHGLTFQYEARPGSSVEGFYYGVCPLSL